MDEIKAVLNENGISILYPTFLEYKARDENRLRKVTYEEYKREIERIKKINDNLIKKNT